MWFSSNRNDFLLSKQNTAANVNLGFLFVMVVPFDLCVICQLPGSAQYQETHLFHSPHGNFFKSWQNDFGAKINWRINVWQ